MHHFLRRLFCCKEENMYLCRQIYVLQVCLLHEEDTEVVDHCGTDPPAADTHNGRTALSAARTELGGTKGRLHRL